MFTSIYDGFEYGPDITSLRFSTWKGAPFAIDNVTGVGQGVIPEPATWAMMIAGFGLVGFAARRRRSLAI